MRESVVRFKTIFLTKGAPENYKCVELLKWCKIFSEKGLTPVYSYGAAGNLNFRTSRGFIITASGIDIGKARLDDLVEVVKVDPIKKEIHAIGLKEPSSESFMHNFVYEKRADVKAVFHGHNTTKVMKDVPTTAIEKPSGSFALAKEVEKILGENDFIIIKNHGFLSLGKSIEEAGELALKFNR